MILVGGFYQPPPLVPEEMYGETDKFCFESGIFKNAYIITLKTVFRQNNLGFINAVNEIERGFLSD